MEIAKPLPQRDLSTGILPDQEERRVEVKHKTTERVIVALMLSLMAVCVAGAAPFEPQFTIAKVAGTCQAQVPGTNDFTMLEEAQTCSYGTVITTSNGSSCIVSFSEDNGCLICQNTIVTIEEQKNDKTAKILRISEGEVEFNLEKGFRKHNRLSVITPNGICEAIACTCAVEFKIIGDLKTSSYRCTEGDVRIRGEYFQMEDLGAGEQVTVAQSPNDNFIRIKVVKGDVTFIVKDENGAERKITMTTGDELTIMTNASATEPSKMDVVYKAVFADTQKPEQTWVHAYAKAAVPPPDEPGKEGKLAPPLPSDRKWSSLTVEPPIPTVTPVGLQ